jgi:hypothetical protein
MRSVDFRDRSLIWFALLGLLMVLAVCVGCVYNTSIYYAAGDAELKVDNCPVSVDKPVSAGNIPSSAVMDAAKVAAGVM